MDATWLLLGAILIVLLGGWFWFSRKTDQDVRNRSEGKKRSTKPIETSGQGRVTVGQVIYTDPWHAWLVRDDGGGRILLSKATAERCGISSVSTGEAYDARWIKRKGKHRLDVVELSRVTN